MLLPARTSCRTMMALMSGALKTCSHSLGTVELCCIGRPAWLLFVHVARGPQRTVGRVTTRSAPRREAGSGVVGHAAHQSPLSRSGATAHMAASEPPPPPIREAGSDATRDVAASDPTLAEWQGLVL
jgi:hypothetical protein